MVHGASPAQLSRLLAPLTELDRDIEHETAHRAAAAGPAEETATSSTLRVEMVAEDPHSIYFNKVLCQGLSGTCLPLSSVELREARARFHGGRGDRPSP